MHIAEPIDPPDVHNVQTIHDHDLTVSLEQLGSGVVLVHVSGEVDLRSADTLRRSLDTAALDAHALVLDFTEVTFLATAGLTCLIELSATASRSNLPWALATTARPVLRALEATGYLDLVPVHSTREAATAVVLAP